MHHKKERFILLLGLLYLWSLFISISLQTVILTAFLVYVVIFEDVTLFFESRVIRAFFIFFGLSVFLSMFSYFKLYAIRKIAGVVFDTLVPLMFGFAITEHNLQSKIKKHGLVTFIILSTLTLVFYAYSPRGFSPVLNKNGILTGFLGGKLTYAGVINSFGGIIMERILEQRSISSFLCLLLLVLSTGINTSRSYMLGIIFSAITITFVNFKKYYRYFLLILLLLVVSAIFFPKTRKRLRTTMPSNPDSSIRIRIDLWKMGLKILRKHPLTGLGFEVWPKVADNLVEKYGSDLLKSKIKTNSTSARAIRGHFHNTYLQMAINGGIILLVFYLYLIFTMLKESFSLKEPMKSAFLFMFVTFIVAGFFEYNFSDAEVSHAVFFFSGLYLQRNKR